MKNTNKKSKMIMSGMTLIVEAVLMMGLILMGEQIPITLLATEPLFSNIKIMSYDYIGCTVFYNSKNFCGSKKRKRANVNELGRGKIT